MDCSGLTRLAYLSEGIMLPRDASQQALVGIEIQTEDVADGDLLFFASGENRSNKSCGLIYRQRYDD